MSWSDSYGGTCSAPSSSSSSSSSSSRSSSSSSSSSSYGGYTDGWANNTAYTSSGTKTGFGNNGSSATQNGYSGSGSSSYWNGVYGGNKQSSNPETQKGVYSTQSQLQYLSDQVSSKRATPQEIESAKAMIAGKEAAQGQGVLSGMLSTIGSSIMGPIGALGAKGLSYLGGKAMDSANEYGETPSYQASKQKSKDDSTLVGNLIGFAAPSGVGSMAQTAYDDKMGSYNSYVNGLKSNMISNGYLSQPKQSAPVSSGSGSSSSLINNMMTAQTAPATSQNANEYTSLVDPTDVDWSTFNFYSGSVV